MRIPSERTHFTCDVQGRYICNTFVEAIESTRQTGRDDGAYRLDARPFDIVIVGGGTLGAAIAQHLFYNDILKEHRILVLEAGPYLFPEHVQNLPPLGLGRPRATSIAQLKGEGQFGPDRPRNEVWGLPWHSPSPFPGLAYCLGGCSLFWGGWSPRPSDREMPTRGLARIHWPANVVADLKNGYFDETAEQIGVTQPNPFVQGALHRALRKTLLNGLKAGKVTEAVPLAEVKTHLREPQPETQGVSDEELKLEAPLAVQGAHPRAGFSPFDKFSAMPLLIRAARQAQAESNHDDVQKRLMVVPHCHVKRLNTSGSRVTAVETDQGTVWLPANGAVVIALGTVESTRLAKVSFDGTPNWHLIGKNLMAHLQSNLNIRIPRSALPPGLPEELQTSVLFLKGQHKFADGTIGNYHLQITACGLSATGTITEADLFQKIPDIDGLEAFQAADDQSVVITIRGIGETEPHNPNNQVILDPNPGEVDEHGVRRAFVSLQPTLRDIELWNAVDKASDEVAKVFAAGKEFEVFTPRGLKTATANDNLELLLPYTQRQDPGNPGRRDGLGATPHQAGTLWMGENPTHSVTDPFGRFHMVENAYAVGPAVLPTIGSPDPTFTGIALARRLADRLIPQAPEAPQEAGFKYLFNGSEHLFNQWRMVGSGSFAQINRALVAQAGNDIGLLYYTKPIEGDFTLRLQFRLNRVDDNSGVFVRSLDPSRPVPERSDPNHPRWSYNNQAYVGVETGFEVQIDELARGDSRKGQPDGMDERRTGAIYNIPIGAGVGQQNYRRGPILQPGQWNDLEIEVIGQTYTVRLNGRQTTQFTNNDAFRGRASDPSKNLFSGFIGLQTHTGRVAFANVRYCVGKAQASAVQAPRPAGTRHTATLEYLPGWREQQAGYIVQGGRLVIKYDPQRLPSADTRRRCLAFARFHPSGDLYSSALPDGGMELTVPMNSTQVEVWFQSIDSSGAVQSDSRFGQNYWYQVLADAPLISMPVVNYRAGAIPNREEVSVFDEAVIRRQLKPAPAGRPAVETQVSLKARVRGEPFTKNVWADMHVFDRSDRLINRKTVPLQYEQPAPGEGEIFAFHGTVDPEAVAIAGGSGETAESTKVQYRLYYEVNDRVYTDGDLHQVEVEEQVEA